MLWPHQQHALSEIVKLRAEGAKRILVTSPTGGGKTRVMRHAAEAELTALGKCALYTNRRLLLAQTSDVLDLPHGIRADGYETDLSKPLQICSVMTEYSRCIKSDMYPLHEADLVLVDEAHLQTGDATQEVFRRHIDAGATVVGFTATPLELSPYYDTLVVAGKTSDLRACGALVAASHYGPDEPDLASLKKAKMTNQGEGNGSDLTDSEARAAMGFKGRKSSLSNPTLFGRVSKHFLEYNPDRRPTILFAPGVDESLWFAEQFHDRGIPSAHLDASRVWMNGQFLKNDPESREKVLAASKSGEVVVLCNRFILREGIDCPWLSHGILATVFGSIQSYLQSGGRLLRAGSGKTGCTIQDHGGNWHRHGSLNDDREWDLDDRPGSVFGLRAEAIRSKKKAEPWRCAKCARIMQGRVCTACGWTPGERKSRPVVTADGDLVELTGPIFKPRRVAEKNNAMIYRWRTMLIRSRRMKEKEGSSPRTFAAAAALFAIECMKASLGYVWPGRDWPGMPRADRDYYRQIRDVPEEDCL